jgi:signal transduction histidine kinase
VTLKSEAGEAGVDLHFDPEQVQQVLVNIVLNAVQASPRGGEVVLRHGRRGAWYAIEVADQGRGIPAEVAARLFEPFFTTKERGTGLGLAISQRIVTAHGGEIRLAPREGGGTVVEVLMPLTGAGSYA